VTPAPSSSAPGPGDRAAPGWSPLPARSCLQARGRDAVTFVDHFTTAAVARLEPAAGCEGFFTDARGWVLALTSIMRTADGLWIDAAAGIAPVLLAHLEHYHIREDVELVDASATRASYLIAGPTAADWLAAHGTSGARAQGAVRLGGVAADVARPAWCGDDGFLVQVAAADGPRLEAWLVAAGLPRLDTAAVAARRLEAGWPEAEDIPAKTLPQELGRDAQAISFTKGCYLGQETVARLDALGHVNRRLVALATDTVATVGAEVRCGAEPVAQVTSACFSPRLSAGLALAIVPLRALAAEATLTVAGAATRVVPVPLAPAVPAAADTEEMLLAARRFNVVRVTQRCADGTTVPREVVVHPGSVVVVPLVSPHEVCLVEAVRVAVGGTLLELPAGTLDREESPAAAAARELAEETGYRAGRIEAAGAFWMSPGILRERMHLFVAHDLTAGPQALEPGEELKTRRVAWSEAVAMCLDGRIDDAKTIAGILLLDARRRAGERP
jgi:folate-binding protein YgfZ